MAWHGVTHCCHLKAPPEIPTEKWSQAKPKYMYSRESPFVGARCDLALTELNIWGILAWQYILISPTSYHTTNFPHIILSPYLEHFGWRSRFAKWYAVSLSRRINKQCENDEGERRKVQCSASERRLSKQSKPEYGVLVSEIQSPYTPCPFYKYTKLCKYKYNLINFRRQISTFSYTFLVNFAPLNQQFPMAFIIFVKLKHTQLSIERQN